MSNNQIPENYTRRILKMDPDEVERLQKETWKAKKEARKAKKEARTSPAEAWRRELDEPKPQVKLDRLTKQMLRFFAGSIPLGAIASYYCLQYIILPHMQDVEETTPPEWYCFLAFSVLLFLFTLPIGMLLFYVYSQIFQPWVFTKIPEDKLPPLNDANGKTSVPQTGCLQKLLGGLCLYSFFWVFITVFVGPFKPQPVLISFVLCLAYGFVANLNNNVRK